MNQVCPDDFVKVDSAEAAVDRLAMLYQQATNALRRALKQYLKDRNPPSAAHCAFRYPELRLTYHCQAVCAPTPRYRCPAPTR